jgi:hypothetical protein
MLLHIKLDVTTLDAFENSPPWTARINWPAPANIGPPTGIKS